MIYPDNAATTSVGEKNGDAQAVGVRAGCEGEVAPSPLARATTRSMAAGPSRLRIKKTGRKYIIDKKCFLTIGRRADDCRRPRCRKVSNLAC